MPEIRFSLPGIGGWNSCRGDHYCIGCGVFCLKQRRYRHQLTSDKSPLQRSLRQSPFHLQIPFQRQTYQLPPCNLRLTIPFLPAMARAHRSHSPSVSRSKVSSLPTTSPPHVPSALDKFSRYLIQPQRSRRRLPTHPCLITPQKKPVKPCRLPYRMATLFPASP